MTQDLQCRFGDGPAVGIFSLPGGCVVYPDDREQALCTHHALKATPGDGIYLVQDLTVGGAFGKFWAERLLRDLADRYKDSELAKQFMESIERARNDPAAPSAEEWAEIMAESTCDKNAIGGR